MRDMDPDFSCWPRERGDIAKSCDQFVGNLNSKLLSRPLDPEFPQRGSGGPFFGRNTIKLGRERCARSGLLSFQTPGDGNRDAQCRAKHPWIIAACPGHNPLNIRAQHRVLPQSRVFCGCPGRVRFEPSETQIGVEHERDRLGFHQRQPVRRIKNNAFSGFGRAQCGRKGTDRLVARSTGKHGTPERFHLKRLALVGLASRLESQGTGAQHDR